MKDDQENLNSKLEKMILSSKWRKVRGLLSQVVSKGDYRVQDDLLSIVVAGLDPPLDVVQALLRISPCQSLHQDDKGMVPLHIACLNGSPFDVVQTILDHDNGAGAESVDILKRRPLHYAVQYICQPDQRDLVDIGPSSSATFSYSMSDKTTSAKDQSMKSVFTSLGSSLKRRSRKLSTSTSRGGQSEDMNMLTMSLERFREQMKVVQILTVACPNILMSPDLNDNTPIDILQECKAKEDISSSKWERVDICCAVLRKIAIEEYREVKKGQELKGSKSVLFHDESLAQLAIDQQSCATRSTGSSTGTEGYSERSPSNLSRAAADESSSSDHMDLSSADFD